MIRKLDSGEKITKHAAIALAPYYLGQDFCNYVKVNNNQVAPFQKVHDDYYFCQSCEYSVAELKAVSRS
jgi:hypothetical protein